MEKLKRYSWKCKECSRSDCKEYYKKNKNIIKKRVRRWWKNHREYGIKRQYKYYSKNRKILNKNDRIRHKKERKEARQRYGISLMTIQEYGLKLALEIYDRAGRKCEICGNINNLLIHHKNNKGTNYRKRGLKPNNTSKNLQVLCWHCHGRLHALKRWKKK